MEQCLFCEIVNGNIPSNKVYETDTVLAFLDIHPVNPGHVLIIPKKHYRDGFDAPAEVVADLAKTLHKMAPAVLQAVGSEAYNVAVNSGRDAGQVIFHAHWHLIPRFPGDGHRLWKGKAEYEGGVAEIAGKIKERLGSSV